MCGGVWLSAAQKPISRPGWWKGKFALFQMPATEGRGWWTSVQRLTYPVPQQAVDESIYRQSGEGGEVTCRNSTVISNSHLQLVISGLTSIILVVLGTVNL